MSKSKQEKTLQKINCLDDVNLNNLFQFLRERWQVKTGKTSHELAALIEERPQCVSSWCTGFGNRKPPLRLVIYLTRITDTEIRINENGVQAYSSDNKLLSEFELTPKSAETIEKERTDHLGM